MNYPNAPTNRGFSPNHDQRGMDAVIDTLVLHYTGMRDAQAAIARLCDPAAAVSAHYVIKEDGEILLLVPEDRRAWHAGVSAWRGHTDLNARSIGIEIVNPGHEFGYRDFPRAQMEALADLANEILVRHPSIEPRNVVAHSDIAPERKEDPGERFDWAWLAGQGIGCWPEAVPVQTGASLSLGKSGPAVETMQRRLKAYGYNLAQNAYFDAATERVVVAFQRHFRQRLLNGVWDAECDARLAALLRMV